MPLRLALLILGGWLLAAQVPAWAIVIEFDKQRIAGFVDQEDADQIVVRFKTPDGKEKVAVYERSKIKIIHQADRARLEKLAKDNPKDYRDYATDLAKQTADPEAKAIAMRLFVIAAYLDPPNLGRSSLVSMSALAANPADARKYRAMAYLLDAKNDPTLLKSEAVKPISTPMPMPETKTQGLADFLKALKQYRSGDSDLIKDTSTKTARVAGVADLFSKAPGKMSQKDFIKACNDALCTKCTKGNSTCPTCKGMGNVVDPMGFGFQQCATCKGKRVQKCNSCDGFGVNAYSEEYLKVILRAEIWAIDQLLAQDSTPKKSTGDLSWSRTVNNQQTTPAPVLRLESITEYDPRECLYRGGKWVAP